MTQTRGRTELGTINVRLVGISTGYISLLAENYSGNRYLKVHIFAKLDLLAFRKYEVGLFKNHTNDRFTYDAIKSVRTPKDRSCLKGCGIVPFGILVIRSNTM